MPGATVRCGETPHRRPVTIHPSHARAFWCAGKEEAIVKRIGCIAVALLVVSALSYADIGCMYQLTGSFPAMRDM